MEITIFKSQACTTLKQSCELMGLGLKPETADMTYISAGDKVMCSGAPYECESRYENKILNYKCIPGWSLHRLMSLCPESISHEGHDKFFCVNHRGVYYEDEAQGRNTECFDFHEDLYINMTDCIAWLIKNDYFEKKYLEIK